MIKLFLFLSLLWIPLSVSAEVSILQLNDVYSINPIPDGTGGLARVATIERKLSQKHPNLLTIVAGDFISPSPESQFYKGKHMIDILNHVGVDMATLGNHEFDFGVDILKQRMSEAKFTWIVSNVIDKKTRRPINNSKPFLIRNIDGKRYGFIGLCIKSDLILPSKTQGLKFLDPINTAKKYTKLLKKKYKVDHIIAITHLDYAEDLALAELLPDIDLILGGHDHTGIISAHNKTLISKSISDARQVNFISIGDHGQKKLTPITIDSSLNADPKVQELITAYNNETQPKINALLGQSLVPLEGREELIRSQETNLGNWVADSINNYFQADISLILSSGIRGDQVYPAGDIIFSDLLSMHPFGNDIYLIKAPGHLIQSILEHSISHLPATDGRFMQISKGLAIRINPHARTLKEITVNDSPLELNKIYNLAISDYVFWGGQGHKVPHTTKILKQKSLVDILELSLKQNPIINPKTDNRITFTSQ